MSVSTFEAIGPRPACVPLVGEVDTPRQSPASRPSHGGASGPCVGAEVVYGMQECFQALLRKLPWPWDGLGRSLRSVGFTSCYPGEGVSTVAACTALCAAQSGPSRVALVDANLAEPSVHRIFGVSPTPGLADVLGNGVSPAACLQATRRQNLSLLTAGGRLTAPTFDSIDRGTALLKHLQDEFGLVVVDLPAVGRGEPSLPWFRLLDGIVLVLEDRRVRREVGQKARQSLVQAGAVVLGVALNKRDQPIPDWLYRTL